MDLKPTALSCAIAAAMLLAAAPPRAAEPSVETGLFQEHCGRCHSRAGVLLRESLEVVDGTLRTKKSGKELQAFVAGHFGRRSQQDIEAITAALLRISRREGRFQQRCGICHSSAEDLARHELMLTGGELRGRYSGRDIGEFLQRHGTSSPEEAAFFEDVLRRIAQSLP